MFKCDYGARTYQMTMDKSQSPYVGMKPTIMSLDFLPYYSTVDDPALIDAAKQLSYQTEGRDDRVKAAVVLSMVQQNIKYDNDEKIYGEPEVWGLPNTVADLGKGDCDCMSNLYASLAHNMGLDVISVIVTGHMFPAVCFDGGHGKSYEHDGKTYYHMEATANVPVAGRYWNRGEHVYATAYPEVPNKSFKKILDKM
jgi:hypothetical protein